MEPVAQLGTSPEGEVGGSRDLVLAWLLCLAPRGAFIALSGGLDHTNYLHVTSAPTNYHYAIFKALCSTLWFVCAHQAVPYVAVLVAIQSLLGPLVMRLCRVMGYPRRAAALSVVAVALLPYYVSVAARQPQVGLTVVLFAWTLALFCDWLRTGMSAASGLSLALVAFALFELRPNALLTIVAMFALVASRWRGVRIGGTTFPSLRCVVTPAAVFAALCMVATGFNVARHGLSTPFPYPPNSGYNLYVGNNRWVSEYLSRYDIRSLEDIVTDHGLPRCVHGVTDPAERDRLLAQAAVDYALGHPIQTISNAATKMARYWDFRLENSASKPWQWNMAYTVPYATSLLLAGVGVISIARRGRGNGLTIIGAVLVSYAIPHGVYFGTVRMRMTTEFLILMLAGWGAHATLSSLVARSSATAKRG